MVLLNPVANHFKRIFEQVRDEGYRGGSQIASNSGTAENTSSDAGVAPSPATMPPSDEFVENAVQVAEPSLDPNLIRNESSHTGEVVENATD